MSPEFNSEGTSSLESLPLLEQATKDAFLKFKAAWETQKTTYTNIIKDYHEKLSSYPSDTSDQVSKVPNGLEQLSRRNEELGSQLKKLQEKLDRKRKLVLTLHHQKEKWKNRYLNRTPTSSSIHSSSKANAYNVPRFSSLPSTSTHELSNPVYSRPSSTTLSIPSQINSDPFLSSDMKSDTKNSNQPKDNKSFKYQTSIRQKDQRQNMHASDCACCSDWYQQFPNPNHQKQVSKHRTLHEPPSTPDGFWDLGFPENN